MKNLFLLIAVSVLLVASGVAQTPVASGDTDQASIKGCLGGSDGSYIVAEDGTTQTFKITSSTVDLKAHVGHDVEVTGQRTTATSSGSSDNSLAVTTVNMISDHCGAAIASAPIASASTPAVVDTTIAAPPSTPVVAETTPAATTPAVIAPAPAVADPSPAQTASVPVAASTGTPESTDQLPNTGTSLPLIGLLGLGLFGLGLLSSRSRTN
jgi:LPXTG-motif cell wall-anchored protein